MMRKILIIILFFESFTGFSLENISFLDYGVVIIGDGEVILGQNLWEIVVITEDSIYNLKKTSKSTSTFVFFNLLENIAQKKIEGKEIIIEIYRNEKEIHKQNIEFEFYPKSIFQLSKTQVISKVNIKGEIIDAYSVITNKGEYKIVRTNYGGEYRCWYLLFKEDIITIHTEKKSNKVTITKEIILSDFNNDEVPEFTFFHENNDIVKCIHFNGKEKTIAKKEANKIILPKGNDRYQQLIYKGFFYTNLTQF